MKKLIGLLLIFFSQSLHSYPYRFQRLIYAGDTKTPLITVDLISDIHSYFEEPIKKLRVPLEPVKEQTKLKEEVYSQSERALLKALLHIAEDQTRKHPIAILFEHAPTLYAHKHFITDTPSVLKETLNTEQYNKLIFYSSDVWRNAW